MVQREDGFERRRVWRCGLCGVVVGYEVERHKGGKEVGRVVYLLDGGLVETGEMVWGFFGFGERCGVVMSCFCTSWEERGTLDQEAEFGSRA